jgi:hypothetical protein
MQAVESDFKNRYKYMLWNSGDCEETQAQTHIHMIRHTLYTHVHMDVVYVEWSSGLREHT